MPGDFCALQIKAAVQGTGQTPSLKENKFLDTEFYILHIPLI